MNTYLSMKNYFKMKQVHPYPRLIPTLFIGLLLQFNWSCSQHPLVKSIENSSQYTTVGTIFKSYCTRCHGEKDDLQGGLDLRSPSSIAEGGKSGPVILPGNAKESLLFEMIHEEEMPPDGGKLSPKQIKVIQDWIDGLES